MPISASVRPCVRPLVYMSISASVYMFISGGRHNLHRVCQTAVTAPPRVGRVVWNLCISVSVYECVRV